MKTNHTLVGLAHDPAARYRLTHVFQSPTSGREPASIRFQKKRIETNGFWRKRGMISPKIWGWY
jgi:hypothetical protein